MSHDVIAVLRRHASQALARMEIAEAERVIERLEQEDPLSAETAALRLELLSRSDRASESAAYAAQALTLHPGSARLHYLAGRLAYGQKQYAEAERHFRECEALAPHWRQRLALGKTLTQLGRLAEAEPILLALLPEHAECGKDLAWLLERQGQDARALTVLEGYLAQHPEDRFAQSQRLRLRARLSGPDALLREMDALLGLGEAVNPDLLPEYCETLLRKGESARARELVHAQRAALDPRVKVRLAWATYKLQAYDLAFELFLDVLPEQRGNPKFLTALEAAARRTNQIARLIASYEQHASQERRLYGHLARLRKSGGPEAP